MRIRFKLLLASLVLIYCIGACYFFWAGRRTVRPQTYSLPSQGVHIPFTFRKGLMYVSAMANGKPASWLVDTGSTAVVWPARFLNRDYSAQPFKFQGYADNMWVSGTWGTLNSLEVGSYRIANLPGERRESKSTEEFILGNPALKDICVVIDFKRHELILQESSAAKYSKNSAIHVLNLLQTSCPVAKGGLVVVQGKLAGKPARFVIDTGCNGLAIAQRFADKYLKSYHRGRATVTGQSGTREASAVTGVSGDIPGLRFQDSQAIIVRDVPDGDAIIGTPFLKNFRVTIDYPKMKLILENP